MIGELAEQLAPVDVLFTLAVPAGWWAGWHVLAKHTAMPRFRTSRSVAVLLVLRYELSLLAALAVVAVGTALGLGPFARGTAMIASDPIWVLGGCLGAGVLWLAANRRRWKALARTPVDRRTLVHTAILGFDAGAEEVIYRGLLLLGLLVVAPSWVAVGASAILFGLAHFPVGGWRIVALHAVTGLGFCILVVGSGGIAASVVAHVTYNTLVVFERRARSRGAGVVGDPSFAPSFAPSGSTPGRPADEVRS